ncbi:calcium/sodium antiporter [Necropsobacter massiliensis]|uniref:calcium/sodium antiporter n=1 Tax=Necropsobacter massiliensis TaxID=1400001 RepID=UPI000595AD98|nr:calcium/sodium antiporter [Necropsobacter massiliensis]
MLIPVLALFAGLMILIWSAERFIEGAADFAAHLGMPPLLIGILVIGFGTSAPEMIVSALSALNRSPGIALGNAYGSNITNIALILGLTALIKPIMVNPSVLKKELPILTLITLLSAFLIYDATISRVDALVLLLVFAIYMFYTIEREMRSKKRAHSISEVPPQSRTKPSMSLRSALLLMLGGLVLLVGSSQLLVWGAVQIAAYLGVSDLVIGLTIVAIGTSLPELAASVVAAKKGQADLALGNIIGSNLFNTLAVVGIAGAIMPIQVENEIFSRDFLVMLVLTLSLFLFGYGWRKKTGMINRFEGAFLLLGYLAYTLYLLKTAL